MYILGINSLYHESAACLVHHGWVVAMAEEERFNRQKHGKTPRPDNADELPLRAMHYCLETAGIDIRDVDHAGYSSQPQSRLTGIREDDREYAEMVVRNIERVPGQLRGLGFRGEFSWVDHHTAHAASAFYPSPFAEAAVLSIDGIGDTNSTAFYHGRGNQLKLIGDVAMPHSIGFLWELTTMLLGFDIYDAAKTMGLAAYGDPDRYAEQFRELLKLRPEGRFEVDTDVCRFDELDYEQGTGYLRGLERLFGVQRRRLEEELSQAHKDVAAALQEATDEAVLHIARHLQETTGAKDLCLAGGVALNCVTNRRVFEEGPFQRLYVQPAAHDAGTAIGSALFLWNQLLNKSRSAPVTTPYLGPEFADDEIKRALNERKLKFLRCGNIEEEVAGLIADGQVVGWFQGSMEMGPRALGNRSLLADPRNPEMRQMMNEKVKHREFFRPFAPSVLAEEADRWFQIAKPTSAAEYMLMAYAAQKGVRDEIPAVVHTDGTCRIQIVREEANPRYHRLISAFFRQTGVPVVLNTSFNDSEPIVCAPDDAIQTFLKTRIDYLAIGDFLVSKRDNPDAEATVLNLKPVPLSRVCPSLHEGLDEAVQSHRLSRFQESCFLTDSVAFQGIDQVLPLFAEQELFMAELDRSRIANARALEVGVGAGMLSVAVVRAGVAHVTALEINPRAMLFAGFNIVLNGCEDRIEIRQGDADVYAPVRDARFDFIFSNPPFVPTPSGTEYFTHSTSGPYGLDFVERLFSGLDERLNDNGCAQFVTVAPGDARSPFLLVQLAEQHLAAAAKVVLNDESQPFDDLIEWLHGDGTVSRRQAVDMHRRARRDGVTHLHLCVLHYDKRGEKNTTVSPAARSFSDWNRPSYGIEQE